MRHGSKLLRVFSAMFICPTRGRGSGLVDRPRAARVRPRSLGARLGCDVAVGQDCRIEPHLDQGRHRCAAPLARPPPGSASGRPPGTGAPLQTQCVLWPPHWVTDMRHVPRHDLKYFACSDASPTVVSRKVYALLVRSRNSGVDRARGRWTPRNVAPLKECSRMPEPRHRRQTPPADDRELRHVLLAAVVQNLIRAVLEFVLRETWRGGPW